MKKFLIFLTFISFNSALYAQLDTEDDIYNLVVANLPSVFTLTKPDCDSEQYFFKSLYFVDQKEPEGLPVIKLKCENFLRNALLLKSLDDKFKKTFHTHSTLKNLNFILVDTFSNPLFNPETSALMIPLYFNASNLKNDLKNPISIKPILFHEYGHYLIHSNYKNLNLNLRDQQKLLFYFDAIHELLADIFTVVETNDPKIIYNALKSTKYLQSPNGLNGNIIIEDRVSYAKNKKLVRYLLHARDFSDRRNKLETILKKMKNGDKVILQGYFFAPHSMLAPVRKFLWDEFISNPSIRRQLGSVAMTKYLFDQISAFYEDFSSYAVSISPIKDFEFINQKLIFWLKTDLSKKYPSVKITRH